MSVSSEIARDPEQVGVRGEGLSRIGPVVLFNFSPRPGARLPEEWLGGVPVYPADLVVLVQSLKLAVKYPAGPLADAEGVIPAEKILPQAAHNHHIDFSTGFRSEHDVKRAFLPHEVARRARPLEESLDALGLLEAARAAQVACEWGARNFRNGVTPDELFKMADAEVRRADRALDATRTRLSPELKAEIAGIKSAIDIDRRKDRPEYEIQAEPRYRRLHDLEVAQGRVDAVLSHARQEQVDEGAVSGEPLGLPAVEVLNRLLQQPPEASVLALADGGNTMLLPPIREVSDDFIRQKIERATGVETLGALELDLMRYREAVRAVKIAAQAAATSAELPDRLREHARLAGRLHTAAMRKAMALCRGLEEQVMLHYSFFAEAKIPPSALELRASIRLATADVHGMLLAPAFGKPELFGPMEAYLSVHEDVHGMMVFSGQISLSDDLLRLGTVAGAHGALAFVSIPESSLNALPRLCQDRDGEESVVLVHAPIRVRRASIYEDEDVMIDGAFAAAGGQFHQTMIARDARIHSANGNRPSRSLSDAYALYDRKGPFVNDFKRKGHLRPRTVIVAASATNYNTENTSTYCLYGEQTARGTSPTNQILTRICVNHLRRKIQVQGNRVMTDASDRPQQVQNLQKEMRKEFVGPGKPFLSLSLCEDRDSEEGLAALSMGGVRIKAEVTVNSQTEFVAFYIMLKSPDGSMP